jgi:hypothetical protein
MVVIMSLKADWYYCRQGAKAAKFARPGNSTTLAFLASWRLGGQVVNLNTKTQ